MLAKFSQDIINCISFRFRYSNSNSIRFCKPADARQRLVEVGPDILKLDHQLVDVADQLFRPRIAQDFFDAFRNVEDIRGDVVIRQRRERLQDVVELRRDGGNLGHVVVFFDFLDRIRDLASGVEIHLDHELAGEQALGRQRCPQAVADQAIEIFFFGDVAVGLISLLTVYFRMLPQQ